MMPDCLASTGNGDLDDGVRRDLAGWNEMARVLGERRPIDAHDEHRNKPRSS
jgi:hypothetical protein